MGGLGSVATDGAISELPLMARSGVAVSCSYRNRCLVVAADGMNIHAATDGIDEGDQDDEVAADGIPELLLMA